MPAVVICFAIKCLVVTNRLTNKEIVVESLCETVNGRRKELTRSILKWYSLICKK